MSQELTLVNEAKPIMTTRGVKIWRERMLTDDVLFNGTDESGRSGWFLRLMITGLYPRRVGPYRTKRQAIEALEDFIYHVEIEVLCTIQNDLNVNQEYVIEGVPLMIGTSEELQEPV